MIKLGPHCVAILLAKMLIWAPFSQLMRNFFSVLTPAYGFNKVFLVCGLSVSYLKNTFQV